MKTVECVFLFAPWIIGLMLFYTAATVALACEWIVGWIEDRTDMLSSFACDRVRVRHL